MSYRAGLVDEPCVVCDGCGATHPVISAGGCPKHWFLKKRPPPSWTGGRVPIDNLVERRWDLCSLCGHLADEVIARIRP